MKKIYAAVSPDVSRREIENSNRSRLIAAEGMILLENNGILPLLNSHRRDAFLPQLTGDDMSSFSFVHKLMEDKAYNLCAFLIDGHFSVFYIIAEHTASKHNA